ncbi:FAD/NAD(P)-binding protein [Streptomyces sp. NBC_00286]|uniref:FAD/NAD(P)-binding protein n=1 Tax=Streptomyces sp. NBC_00286 TaxID=2975701 RepID=UPI002E287611|nr:FAD/NAD(P)-binding protein [Streptomyces sp. NBC_00286]
MSAATAEPPASAESSAEVSVALVGAGPRGTSVLERLCASAPELLAPGARLTVHVIDPSPPGPGRVWRTDQPAELLMNTVSCQVTLFTDDSVDCSGPIRPGPSLHDWAGGKLDPDEYPTRAQYGQYLEWVFAEVVRGAPPSVRVETHQARAIRLDDAPDGHQRLVLDNGRTLHDLAAVVLAQGHLPTVADRTQQRLAEYADRRGLRHIPPANPADVDLSPLAPGEPVLLRGLGLNFFDHMALLTTARGGRFLRAPQGVLRYVPSGLEPRLYAGSRRGIPYQARGDNAKGPYGRHLPLVLTPDVISAFRKRADNGYAPDFLAEIWPLVAKEVETVYYEALLGQSVMAPRGEAATVRDFRERFLAIPHRDPQEALLLGEFGIAEADRWSWDRISRPYAGQAFNNPQDFRSWLLGYLREDAEQAALGNVDGPLKAALDVLRDLRNEVRLIVDHGGLAGTSRREHLDRWYTPLNAFLSIGPPRRRIEEMIALIEAGVLEVLGPRLEVREEDGAWVAYSPDVPGSTVRATTLVEARLPEPELRRTADDLLARLLKTGQCRPHTVDGYETGGLDVTPRPYRLIDRGGHAHPRRFALGVPTEGVHWVTAAGVRPGVDSVTLSDTDSVARALLRAASTAATPEDGAENRPNVELATID